MIRRKSSGFTRSRFDVDGKDIMGPPRPSLPPEMNTIRSCKSVKISSALMPFSMVFFFFSLILFYFNENLTFVSLVIVVVVLSF